MVSSADPDPAFYLNAHPDQEDPGIRRSDFEVTNKYLK
jgi:hypothetical protein